MSDHGEFVGVSPVGEVVLPAEEDGRGVESSEEEYDPGVFTQSDSVEPDPVQQLALMPVRQILVSDPIQQQHGTDPVQNVDTGLVQRNVIF